MLTALEPLGVEPLGWSRLEVDGVVRLNALGITTTPPTFSIEEAPRVRYAIEDLIDPDTGEKQQTSLFVNYNSETWVEVKSGLIGAGDEREGYGPAQRVYVAAPLVLRHGKLYIDIETLKDILGL